MTFLIYRKYLCGRETDVVSGDGRRWPKVTVTLCEKKKKNQLTQDMDEKKCAKKKIMAAHISMTAGCFVAGYKAERASARSPAADALE